MCHGKWKIFTWFYLVSMCLDNRCTDSSGSCEVHCVIICACPPSTVILLQINMQEARDRYARPSYHHFRLLDVFNPRT